MPQVFRHRRFVEFSDTDMAGIAHFSCFFRYIESAEHALIRSVGLSVHQRLADGRAISFPRVSAQCDYTSPAFCEDELDIDVSIERIGSKSITYLSKVTRDGVDIATGRVVCVCCQLTPGQPPVGITVPAEIAEKLQPFVV